MVDNHRECTTTFFNSSWRAWCLGCSSKSIANVFLASLFIIVSVTRLATAFSASLSERAAPILNDVMYHVNNTYTTGENAVVIAKFTYPSLKNTEESNAISKNVRSNQKYETFITMLRLEKARVNLALVSPVCVVATASSPFNYDPRRLPRSTEFKLVKPTATLPCQRPHFRRKRFRCLFSSPTCSSSLKHRQRSPPHYIYLQHEAHLCLPGFHSCRIGWPRHPWDGCGTSQNIILA